MSWHGKVTVYGEAMTQGSKRLVKNPKTGEAQMIENNRAALLSWRNDVRDKLLKVAPPRPLDAPMVVTLRVLLPRPASHYGTGRNAGKLKPSAPSRPMTGKDLDKVARAIGDAGTGIIWRDDSRIAEWRVRREYAIDGRERVEIEAWEVTE